MTKAQAKREHALRRSDRKKRRLHIAKALYNQWTSMFSHLGTEDEFNARAVREYGETMFVLAREYHELMRQDFPVTHDDYGVRLSNPI